jgi:peroxiredoxin Q/BCP
MSQLRHDYEKFIEKDTVVIAVGPDSKEAFQNFWEKRNIPFIGLADPVHEVARKYEQEVNLLKLGRVPAQMIIDREGVVRYAHYADSMADIPQNDTILAMIDDIHP